MEGWTLKGLGFRTIFFFTSFFSGTTFGAAGVDIGGGGKDGFVDSVSITSLSCTLSTLGSILIGGGGIGSGKGSAVLREVLDRVTRVTGCR